MAENGPTPGVTCFTWTGKHKKSSQTSGPRAKIFGM